MKTATFVFVLTFGCYVSSAQGVEFKDKAENLGPIVNSEHAEIGPMISPDGKYLYFTGEGMPGNTGSPENQDIWVCELQPDGSWGAPKNIGSPINNADHNFINNITPDNNTLVLGNKYNYFDGSMSPGLSFSYRDAKGWRFPTSQTVEKMENKSDYAGYFLGPDNKVLILAIEMKKSHGMRDLYVSFRTGSNDWGKPLNLGAVVNTSGDEDSPFLAADGKTLYYSTNGLEGGYGDRDIWVTKRLDDSWTNWSTPVNMGSVINDAGWNSNFSIPASGEYAYFNSAIDGYGGIDIWRVKLPTEVKPDPVVLISGKVLNANTNEPVKGEIIYEFLPGGKEAGIARVDPSTGSYNIVLPAGKNYAFRANTNGYYAINQTLDASNIVEYGEIERNLLLAPIETNQPIRLNNIFFETGKAVLKEESYPELNRVVKLLTENPSIEIEISGHTDNVGSDESNLTLSQQRAEAVVKYFTDNGIKGSRLIAKGYGESKPIADNETEEGKQTNRRVEFTILKK